MGADDEDGAAVDLEVVAFESVPGGTFPGQGWGGEGVDPAVEVGCLPRGVGERAAPVHAGALVAGFGEPGGRGAFLWQ